MLLLKINTYGIDKVCKKVCKICTVRNVCCLFKNQSTNLYLLSTLRDPREIRTMWEGRALFRHLQGNIIGTSKEMNVLTHTVELTNVLCVLSISTSYNVSSVGWGSLSCFPPQGLEQCLAQSWCSVSIEYLLSKWMPRYASPRMPIHLYL